MQDSLSSMAYSSGSEQAGSSGNSGEWTFEDLYGKYATDVLRVAVGAEQLLNSGASREEVAQYFEAQREALRGEKSFGMMCSPRELALPNAPQKRGIIELDDTAVVGEAFNPEKHWKG